MVSSDHLRSSCKLTPRKEQGLPMKDQLWTSKGWHRPLVRAQIFITKWGKHPCGPRRNCQGPVRSSFVKGCGINVIFFPEIVLLALPVVTSFVRFEVASPGEGNPISFQNYCWFFSFKVTQILESTLQIFLQRAGQIPSTSRPYLFDIRVTFLSLPRSMKMDAFLLRVCPSLEKL